MAPKQERDYWLEFLAEPKEILFDKSQLVVMKACVLYLSRTGNTKRFAEAISEAIQSPMFNIEASDPSSFKDFDLLLIGTPVTGFNAAPQVISFIKKLPEGSGKSTILFCTYAVAKGRTFDVLAKELALKGYINMMCVSKKGVKPNKNDFKDATDAITKAITPKGNNTRHI